MAFLSNVTSANSNALTVNHPMSSASHPRASYAICSRNDNNGAFGNVYFDAEFQKIAYGGHLSINGNTGSYSQNSGTYDGTEQNYYNITNTANNTASNGTANYLPGTNNSGEFGNSMLTVSERGISQGYFGRWRTTDLNIIHRQRHSFVNSDHNNRNKVILMEGINLTSAPLWQPISITSMPNQIITGRKNKAFAANATLGQYTSNLASQQGSASYNAVRKELIIMVHNSNTSSEFYVNIFKNVDFNATDCDVSLINTTPDNQFLVTTPNWQNTTTESRYNINVVLVDNGDIYYSVMHNSSQFNTHRIVRNGSDTAGTITTALQSSLTTAYDRDQGEGYGQNAIQTRNKNMVMTFCVYYYYGSGCMSHLIDKRNSSCAKGIENTTTGDGVQPVKYRDDSFAYYFSGNYYADNWTGARILGTAFPRAGATPAFNNNIIYLPLAPTPNTTNYPGITTVWEYDLQTTLPGTGAFYV